MGFLFGANGWRGIISSKATFDNVAEILMTLSEEQKIVNAC